MTGVFLEEKETIQRIITTLKEIISNDKDLEDELNSLNLKLRSNTFNLAVLGQFKRGKTSFINALLGQDLLPTAITPVTSVVTIIKYGEKIGVKTIFSDYKTKEIHLNDLSLYVTERGNPENKKGVLLVEITYPSKYLKEGVVLVDTPGIGSTFLHNTKVTYDYLKKIDAAIFILSADPPISQVEFEFLNDARKHIKKIFFVLNKIDYLNDSEIDEISHFNEEILEEKLQEKVLIYPLSAKLAIDGKIENDLLKLKKSQITKFEKTLNDFFIKDKWNILLESIKNNLNRIIEEMMGFCRLEQKAIQTPVHELEKNLDEFINISEEIKREQNDASPLIKAEIERIMELIDEDLEEFNKEQQSFVLAELEKKFSEIKHKSKNTILEEIQKYYLNLIDEIFEPWRIKEEKIVKEQFEKIINRFSDVTNTNIDKIKNLSKTLFDVDIPHIYTKNVFTLESSLYYKVDEMFVLFSDQFKLMLPKKMFNKILWNNIKQNVIEQLDKNSGRVRYDFLERLNKSSMKFIGKLDEKVDSIVKNIEKAVQKGINEKKKSKGEIKNIDGEISNKLELLNNLKIKLHADMKNGVRLKVSMIEKTTVS